jgi:hypothetical protein
MGGHLAVLQWAREHHCPWDEETCTSAYLRLTTVTLGFFSGRGRTAARGMRRRVSRR